MTPHPELVATSGERESSRGGEPIGSVIDGHYRVLSLLGSGGMAEVYEVEHLGLGRHFALKLLRAELARDAELVGRFQREARAVAKLESAHIVAIVDSGTLHDAPYFVMERLYGEELRELLNREGVLPPQRAVHIALDVCRALTVAHAAGVIHRDLKPENLFITRSELGTDHCKVLDFGVAKLAGENRTMPGTLMGTARYMAPEQIHHSSGAAPFTDIFSLGVILYECLSGQQPFAADTLERVLFMILNEQPRPLLELRPELPPRLAELVHKALSKAGSERPQSAAGFAEALAHFTRERQSNSRPPSLAEDATLLEVDRLASDTDKVESPAAGDTPAPFEPARSNRRASLLAAIVTFGLGLGLGLGLTRGKSSQAPPLASPPVAAAATSAAALAPDEPSINDAPAAGSVTTGATRGSAPSVRPRETRALADKQSQERVPPGPSAPPLFYPAAPAEAQSAPKN